MRKASVTVLASAIVVVEEHSGPLSAAMLLAVRHFAGTKLLSAVLFSRRGRDKRVDEIKLDV